MKYHWNNFIDISQSEIDRIVELARYFATRSSCGYNTESNSLMDFIGYLQSQLNQKEEKGNI